MRRVVVTGIGAITPVGNDVPTMWDNMLKGVCGIDKITRFDTEDLPVKNAGEVKDFDPTQYMDFKEARRMARFSQFAVAASVMAVEDAGLDLEKIDKNRLFIFEQTSHFKISRSKRKEVLE